MATHNALPPDAGPQAFAAGASNPPGPDPLAAAAGKNALARQRQRPRGWRIAGWLVTGLLALALLLAAAGWWWLGSNTSLASALAQAAARLPAGQSLESRDVAGSLRSGGRIAWLRWSSPTWAVEASDIHIGWSLAPLLQRTVHLGEVRAASVRIRHTPQPDAPPTLPPEQLVLPVRVDLAFRIDQLEWAGPPTVQAQTLTGRYHHDRVQHRLEITGMDLAQGHYSGTALLQAQAPMALQASIDGQVHTAAAGFAQALELAAHATLQGTLATAAAQLELAATLRPPNPAAAAPGAAAPAMQADVTAQILPWAPQPLQQASAEFRALNLAALWPQAPVTTLHGSMQAGPQNGGWHIAAQLRNDQPGPWDRQRLPVSALDASADYDGSRWHVPQASVQVGAGRIALQGTYTPAHSTLEGTAQVQGLSPGALHSQLGTAPLSGQLQAQSADQAVRLSANLQAARGRAPAARGKAHIQHLRASGTWHQPLLTLHNLDVDALQAQLHGEKIEIEIDTAPAARGTLALTVPGASARTSGQIGPSSGAGELHIDIAAAERLQAWLQTLPGLAWPSAAVQGQAVLDARWQGGWRSLRQQWLAANTGAPASLPGTQAFTVQATLDAAQWPIALPAATEGAAPTRLQLSRLHAALSGSLAQATLSIDGQARVAERNLALQTQLSAGITPGAPAATQWRAEVAALRLQMQTGQRPGLWSLALAQPLALAWRQAHGAGASAPRNTLHMAGGQATLTAALPGAATLRWQALQLAQTAQGGLQWQTRGELTGLPLAWADALAPTEQTPLAELGLAGNLVLDGQWNVDAGDALRASATLQRASGDIRILTGEGPAITAVHSSGTGGQASTSTSSETGTLAGVRQATLQLDAQGEQVRAHLLWDSARAGHIEADASTQLARQDGGWRWPANAPVAARVRARLPDLGLWSALAPPGWRVHGTLDADATLSGSRSAPRWQGTLGADQFALRSLADGVDLQDGRLRATLQGDRLDITELSLRGGQGGNARIAGYSGNRTAPPRDGGSLQGSGSITWGGAPAAAGAGIGMDITVQAHALQLLARADRQASISGTLRTRLDQGQFNLRGQLSIDRATLILPDESAPSLGSDVVVRSAASDRLKAAKAQDTRRATARAETVKPPDIAITLNLGNDFALQGQGLTTRLEGELDIRSSAVPGAPPRVMGEVRAVQGRYRAWGQLLNVETGLVRFNGAYNNPALDILALRPDISVRAGVQISGTALAPRVRLYAEPDLPDAEKLSWVVLGRNTASGGGEAVLLQQAALTLLGARGNTAGTHVASRLGLDEIGFKGPGSGEDATGAALTFGKRLSKDFYVTYEHSISGTLGTLYVFYDLSRRLTLRGQTGASSALDLIFTLRYD